MKSQSTIIQFDWNLCHYYHQKWIALKPRHTIYNYKYFLSDLFYSGSMQKRQLLVIDEAHAVESEVSDFKSFTVFNETITGFLPKLNIPDKSEYDIETWIAFGTELREKLLNFIDKVDTVLERNIEEYPFTEKNLIDVITKEKNLATVIEDMRNNKENWIVTDIEKAANNQLRRASATPIDVSPYFKDILDTGTISLFMSATILSKDYLCKIGGIKSDQVKLFVFKSQISL
jgi:ATP-dependent DNA helicase DinG